MAANRTPFAEVEDGKAQRGAGGHRIPPFAVLVIAAIIVLAVVAIVPRIAGTSQAGSSSGTSGASSAKAVASAASADEGSIAVSLRIDGTDGGHGVIFDGTVSIPDGGSVYDALLASGIDITSKSSLGMGAYIQGIDGLMEKEQSKNSGWLYYVDGSKGSSSCDVCRLSDGDSVEWVWRLDALNAS